MAIPHTTCGYCGVALHPGTGTGICDNCKERMNMNNLSICDACKENGKCKVSGHRIPGSYVCRFYEPAKDPKTGYSNTSKTN